ncbi:MAG: hypothetical protein ABIH70_07180 [Chloroflexota bacterium]
MSIYPGHVDFHPTEIMKKNVVKAIVPEVIKSLTTQPKEAAVSAEPEPGSVVFKGTMEEVNRYFYEQEWSEGIPIIPPTVEKVEEFLKYTTRPADQVLAVLLPDKREATARNIAVNGVMAGCRPEYMPVLVAMVEALADPRFGHEHMGHTPGTEVLITLNGTIIKDLGFNYEQGALRVGFQANTSIGRFWRLYLRNVAGFLPHKTDKATFGGTWRVILAENEDAVAKMGWEPMSVDQGFKTGDNVVTISSCTSTDSLYSVGGDTAEKILDTIAARVTDIQLHLFSLSMLGQSSVRPQILLSPCLAEGIAGRGYSKAKAKQYLYEHALFAAKRFELMFRRRTLHDAVKEGKLPKQYGRSADPERLLPIVWSPDDFMITVSGDPDRDNCVLCAQNGFIGYPVSKKIDLPKNWTKLLKAAKGA